MTITPSYTSRHHVHHPLHQNVSVIYIFIQIVTILTVTILQSKMKAVTISHEKTDYKENDMTCPVQVMLNKDHLLKVKLVFNYITL